MITDDIKNIKGTKSDLRKFGIAVSIVLGFVGLLFLWRGKSHYICFLILSPVFLLLGLSLPGLLKIIHKVWMSFAIVINSLITNVFLFVFFYFVLTSVSLFAKLLGKRFLDAKFDKKRDSFWISKEVFEFDKKNYERQF